MNNSDFPNANEDLADFLSHPQHWAGTECFLQLKNNPEELSVLHYNALTDRFFWRRTIQKFSMEKTRLGYADLISDLIKEGWVLADA